MMLKRIRIGLWLLVGLAALAGIFIALQPKPADLPAASSQVMTEIGGPFVLTGTDGKPFSSSRLAGRPHAIFFGFTHCPDVCPTTLARLVRLRAALPEGAASFEIVFISVDPERDSPVEMARYAKLFDTPVIALTGTAAAIERVKLQYGVYSAKALQAGGDYTVDHTASVFLVDGTGKFFASLSPGEGDPAARAKLERLARE
jgi:protein SCO1/2